MRKKGYLVVILILCMLLFSACESSYEHLIGENAAEETVNSILKTNELEDFDLRTVMMEVTLSVSEACKVPAILFIPLSIATGILLLNVFQNTAGIKKTAILLFLIGIPTVLFTLSWGMAILYTVLFET